MTRPAFFRGIAYVFVFLSGAAAMYAFNKGTQRSAPPLSDVSSHSTYVAPAIDPESVHSDHDPIDLKPVLDLPDNEQTLEQSEVSPAPLVDELTELKVTGVTEPAPGRYAKLALATSQAVAFVDVKVGDRVKKGWQVFSHWESPERLQAVKADLEKTKKLLDVAKTRAAAATQTIVRLKKLQGTVSGQELQDSETNAAIRQGELEAAQLAVSQSESHFAAMEFEFNQAFVTSPIAGVVVSVDVIPGERRQLSSGFRGVTVLDTRVLHCRCLLTQQQMVTLQKLAAGSVSQASNATDSSNHKKIAGSASVESDGKIFAATVASIGIQAEAGSGLIPVILEVQNPDESLRSGIRVSASFRSS